MSGWPSFWYPGQRPVWWARGLSYVYRGVMQLRRWCYGRGLCVSHRLAVPVVVVGNRVVGGAGKTPLMLALVPWLQAQGWKVGIISRGYGRRGTGVREVTEASLAEMVGDEPLMLHRQLAVPVVVGADRVAAGRHLLTLAPVDLILSDDGWQHWALARDAVIEVVDAQRGYGNGWCLPAGPLREPVNSLPGPDLTLYNGEDFVLEPLCWRNLANGARVTVTDFPFHRVNALAGIGHPQRFFRQLEAMGLMLEMTRPLADHQALTPVDFDWDTGQWPLVMTAKDGVRCQSFAQAHWWVLEVSTQLRPQAWLQVQALFEQVMNKESRDG